MADIEFGGVIESVVTRKEFTLEHAKEVLKDETVAVLGYGIQGRSQALNMRDNGINVVVGQRPGKSYDAAVKDGWIPGKTLLTLEEAVRKATVVQYLLTDAGQKDNWPAVKAALRPGSALYFSHGFSITFRDQTGVVPPDNVDVILVAPKGPGAAVRTLFLAGKGVNSSYAVYQDSTGRAKERTIALGMAIGSGYLFPTTIEKEAISDLVGERGVLLGALAGIMEAQYQTFRGRGHSPSEAFNETVEELTQGLIGLVAEKGMDFMFANCSETARIGALRWAPRFRDTVRPLFEALYDSVESGKEANVVLTESNEPGFKEDLSGRLERMRNSEMWRAGQTVRDLRPEKN